MNVPALIAEIEKLGIELGQEEGRIWYRPRSAMTPDLVERMKAHKPELLAMLRDDAGATTIDLTDASAVWRANSDRLEGEPSSLDLDGTVAAATPDRPGGCLHYDSACWVNVLADDRPGWIRTTCRWCERFIGYRPEDTK